MTLRKPKALNIGDRIAVVAPSAGISAIFPHRLERGIAALEKIGFQVVRTASVSRFWEGQGGTPKERADELHEVFADTSIQGIVCAIGGLTANSVVPLLDYDLIAKNPKVFCGYSDIGVLHFAIRNLSRLVTFYGPCILTEFAEYPEMHPYTEEMFKAATMSTAPLKRIPRSDSWTDEFLNWGDKSDLSRPRILTANTDGHMWLRKGRCEGRLEGGCVYTVHQMRGTPYQSDYTDSILVLETPEGMAPNEGFPLSFVESQLVDLSNSGVFAKIRGLVFGRPMGYSVEQRARLTELVSRVAEPYSFPILMNVNIGHAAPIMTVPLGVRARLDSAENAFEILESGVE
jgi:muramoyltetrapeptide carboxypeptidase LdcA involved in peptidoglycan recycling